DHGVRQDCSEEVKNPSDAVVQEQKETAASIFQEMESEESLVPTSLMSMSKAGHSAQVPATAPEKNKKARARGGNAGSAPLVVASKQRAKTANSLAEAERLLNKAQKQGEDVLNIAAPKLLGKECSEDPTLDVIRSRLTLVSLALNSSTEKDGEIASKRLHALAMEDKLPTADHVLKMAEKHRASIAILKKLAECLSKESETWQSQVKALLKAKQDEETAQTKAAQKAESARAKEIAKQRIREQKKQEREQQQEQAKAAAATEAQPGPEPLLNEPKKRRRTGGIAELSEDDPTILKEMTKFSGGSLVFANDLHDFGRRVCLHPEIACGVRLKSTPVRKVLAALAQLVGGWRRR
ncbi:unnamed protein product, partial [Durusdinium trenchii]